MDSHTIKDRLFEAFSLRPGEGVRTLLSTAYLYLVIATYIALKAARDSLFLGKFGAVKLPYMIIAVAVGVSIFAAFYIKLATRVRPVPLTVATLLLFASNLVAFWFLAGHDVPWLYPVIYIWGGIYGIVAPAQAWTLMSDVFTTREAKRAFGLIGGGGILGGISGGWLVSALCPRIGTVNFLLVLAGLLTAAALAVLLLAPYRRPMAEESGEYPVPRHLPESLRLVFRSPHLTRIAALVFLGGLATAIADYQFQSLASSYLKGDALTAFFGRFWGTVGLVSLVLQVLLASRLFRWFGLAGTILLMPLSMFAATGLLAVQLSLNSGVLVKGSDSVLKHSLDRSSRELAYLPISRSIKMHVKSAIDMVIDRLGDGTAGLLLILLTHVLAFSVRQLALVNLFVLAAWVTTGVLTGRSYVSELGRSIGSGAVEAASWDEALAGPETLNALRQALCSGEEPRVLAALSIAADNPDWDLRAELRTLARVGSEDVRARALAILLDPSIATLDEEVGAGFQLEDQALFAECVDLIAAETVDERNRLAVSILRRAGGGARGAWVALMLRRLGPEFVPFARQLLARLAEPGAPVDAREAAATAVGLLPASFAVGDLLLSLLMDPDRRVAAAAARSAGAIGSPELLAAITPLLGVPALRRTARQALTGRGDESLPVLRAAMRGTERELPPAARRRVPEVLERIATPRSMALLVSLLHDEDREVVHAAADGIVRLRLSNADLTVVDRRVALEMAHAEAAAFQRHAAQLAALRNGLPETEAGLILVASLQDTLEHHREAIFRALSLSYPPRPIALARQGLRSEDPERRSNAAELLDNLRPRTAWPELIAVLDAEGARAVPSGARNGSAADALDELARDRDGWIRAVALHVIVEARPELAPARIEAAEHDPDVRVREAAAALGGRRGADGAWRTAMSVIEKVMALRRIELFREVPSEQLSSVAALARTITIASGRELCRQGDPPGDLLLLLEGEAVVERDGHTMGRLGPGDALGAWGLFDDEPRPFTAIADTNVTALSIDRAGFEDAWCENPALARGLIARLARRVRELTV